MAIKTYINAGGEIFGEVSGGTRKNYARDALGSVVAVTDAANNKVYSARYKPYGSTLTSTGTEPSFTWAGSLGYLKAAGVIHSEFSVRARFYSSRSARWTRIDPLWPNESAHGYVSACPASRSDPTGLYVGDGCCCYPNSVSIATYHYVPPWAASDRVPYRPVGYVGVYFEVAYSMTYVKSDEGPSDCVMVWKESGVTSARTMISVMASLLMSSRLS